MSRYFDGIPQITYGGSDSANPLSFHHDDKNRVVLGKRMEEHLRFAMCYWHNFVWTGLNPFGGATFEHPWFRGGSPLEPARFKADNAFDFFAKLGVPYYCFHDRDFAPEGATPREVQAKNEDVPTVSGLQEYLENLVNRLC